MNQYEVMYVIDSGLEDQVRNDLIERFSGLVTQNGGTVDRIDEWGKRRLAYPINYKTEGFYVLMYMTAPTDFPRELERNMQINDNVLRYLVIRYEGALPLKREPLKPFVPAQPVSAAPAQATDTTPAPEAEVSADAPAEAEVAPVAEEAPAVEAVEAEAPATEESPAE